MNLEESFKEFRESYCSATQKNGLSLDKAKQNIETLYQLASQELLHPFPFEAYHQRIRSPFDYYQFGLDFFGALVKFDESTIQGKEQLKEIRELVKKGENVILLANHQTEPDPQIISLLLQKEDPQLAEEMIFVAGHRVVTDPVAIPFSKGRNLLCIYSKRYVEEPPELKEFKTLHNRRTLEKLKDLLKEGGKCVYVAPSGGRDRANSDGSIQLSPFDPSSLELFRLVAKDTPTHFYPFAMNTFHLLPPPDGVQVQLGERRLASSVPVHIAFGKEIDMDQFPGAPTDKKAKREARAHYIFSKVQALYHQLI